MHISVYRSWPITTVPIRRCNTLLGNGFIGRVADQNRHLIRPLAVSTAPCALIIVSPFDNLLLYKGGSYSSRFFFYSSSSRIRDSVDGVELYRRLPLRWLGVHIQVRRSSRLIDCLFLNQETGIGLVSSLPRLFSPPLILLISRCGYSENRRDG